MKLANRVQQPYDSGVTWPITLIGAIAAVLLACGLLPPYYEIWKRRGRVIGISEIVRALLILQSPNS